MSPTVNRWCYRCVDCLTVGFADENLLPHRDKPICGACGGQIENMGRVERDRLVRDEYQCACDGRCTGALGPNCECHCGGINHGTGRVVKVVRDIGGVPQVLMRNPVTCQRVASEFRAALEPLSDRAKSLRERRYAGQFLPRHEFDEMLQLERRIAHAMKLRTHSGRMKALRATVAPAEAPAVLFA